MTSSPAPAAASVRLSRKYSYRGQSVGVVRRDGTRVAGTLIAWGPSVIRIRHHEGEYVEVHNVSVDYVVKFD